MKKKIEKVFLFVFIVFFIICGVLFYTTRQNAIKTLELEKQTEQLYTEKEIKNELESRGFTNEIMTTSSKDEDSNVQVLVLDNSNEEHKYYFTTYCSTNHDEWEIYVSGEHILAMPLSFEAPSGKEYVVTESGTIKESVPELDTFDKNNIVILRVERLDSDILDSLNYDNIENY